MSIFDILTGGSTGSGVNMGNIGSSIGSVLESFAGSAKTAARDFTQKAPGGLGGLMGAGALGAVLGNLMSSDMARNVALLGAGAVAWNFYKKWAANKEGAQNEGQAPATAFPAPAQSSEVDPVAELIARSMIYAAKADGQIDAAEEQRMDTVLRGFGGNMNLEPMLARIRKESIDPQRLAGEVSSHEQGEDIFRLSCAVIDIDHFMERGYLDALAKALGISDARKDQLEGEAVEARNQLSRAISAS